MSGVPKFLVLFLLLTGQLEAQNNALNFDGSDDRISGSNTSLPQGNNARTIEAWIKYGTGNDMSIYNYGTEVTNQLFILHLYNGVYIIGFGNDLYTGYAVNDNTWHHIAVTHDGATTTVYVDGIIRGTKSTTYNTTGTDFQIGASFRGGVWKFHYNGNIDEVRVWNVARTQTEIQNNMNVELSSGTGLIAAYHFNQGVAGGNNAGVTTLIDATGSYNGTLNNFALSGSTSNWVSGATPLPVELTYFSADSQMGNVKLKWQTASESNNQGFEVQHSIDGRNWETLNFVPGNGTTTETHNYFYLHAAPPAASNYYRLRQVDYDGAAEFSKTVVVDLSGDAVRPRVFPTMITGELFVQNPGNEPLQIAVFNSTGQLVLTAEDADQLDFSGLKDGVYFVQMKTNNGSWTERVLKNN